MHICVECKYRHAHISVVNIDMCACVKVNIDNWDICTCGECKYRHAHVCYVITDMCACVECKYWHAHISYVNIDMCACVEWFIYQSAADWGRGNYDNYSHKDISAPYMIHTLLKIGPNRYGHCKEKKLFSIITGMQVTVLSLGHRLTNGNFHKVLVTGSSFTLYWW